MSEEWKERLKRQDRGVECMVTAAKTSSAPGITIFGGFREGGMLSAGKHATIENDSIHTHAQKDKRRQNYGVIRAGTLTQLFVWGARMLPRAIRNQPWSRFNSQIVFLSINTFWGEKSS